MSRILRRPMFRGGPVSSYGTGITSGLADGGRVGFDNGGWLPNAGPLPMKLGADLGQFKKVNRVNNIAPFGRIIEDEDTQETVEETEKERFNRVSNYPDEGPGEKLINTTDEYITIGATEGPGTGRGLKTVKNPEYIAPSKTVTHTNRSGEVSTRQVPLTDVELDAQRATALGTDGPLKGVTTVDNTPQVVDPKTAKVIEPEESTAISADDIRAQAALFDELLNEDYEKEKKSAQIGDASDYALKFFQETVGKGKGMKEAAGEVAGFALSKPSKTETVKAGKKKTKQTATVMAINEAVAQGKSDRELKKLLGLADYKGNITLKNAVTLAQYKDNKNDFFDNYKENRKSMGSGEASIFTVQETFGKSPTIITADQVKKGVVVTNEENLGQYFIYPDGKVTTVIPKGDGFVEDIVLSRGG